MNAIVHKAVDHPSSSHPPRVAHHRRISQVEAAFARHDAGSARCVAVLFEPRQHFSRFAEPLPPTAEALMHAAARRGIATIADEVWSGVYRTGSFLGSKLPPPPQRAPTGLRDNRAVAANEQLALAQTNHKGWLPDIIVLGKGLSVGLFKHSALLIRSSLLRLAPPEYTPACSLCCSTLLAALGGVSSAQLARRQIEIAGQIERAMSQSSSWLLPVRGGGFSYEFELRATAESKHPAVVRALVVALCALHMYVVPTPLRLNQSDWCRSSLIPSSTPGCGVAEYFSCHARCEIRGGFTPSCRSLTLMKT